MALADILGNIDPSLLDKYKRLKGGLASITPIGPTTPPLQSNSPLSKTEQIRSALGLQHGQTLGTISPIGERAGTVAPGVFTPTPTTQPFIGPVQPGQPVPPLGTGAGTGVGVQPQEPPEVTQIKQQIESTQAQIKDLKNMQDLMEKGFTIQAPGETPAPTDITTDIQTAVTSFQQAALNEITAVKDAFTSIADVMKNRPSLLDQYNKMMDEAGVPEMKSELARLQTRANVIEEQLETLPEDTKNRVKDFLVSQSQFERITAAEAEPLTKLYNAIARAHTAKAGELTANREEIKTALGLFEKDIAREEEIIKLTAKGVIDIAGLEKGLAEKGIEFAKLPLEIAKTQAEIGALAAPKAGDISTFTDVSGVVTAVNKATGQTLWQSQIGRAGTTAPNISVNPITDPVTGTSKYTQIVDRDTGIVKYIDNTTGQEVDPSQVQLEEGQDALDALINDILSGLTEGI